MLLQGVIDAAVNGGISQYVSAFLGPGQDPARQETLRAVLRHHKSLVKEALALHTKLSHGTPNAPLLARLNEYYQKSYGQLAF